MSDKVHAVYLEGIDWWNRPVFRVIGSNVRLGCTEKLYTYQEMEAGKIRAEITEGDLCIFGSEFDCEPLGDPIDPAKIRIDWDYKEPEDE